MSFRTLIEVIFSSALFINAILFIPQALKILSQKSAQGVSIPTFTGFLLIQLTAVMHGFINHDYLSAIGYIFSMLTCGTVVVLAIFYRKKI